MFENIRIPSTLERGQGAKEQRGKGIIQWRSRIFSFDPLPLHSSAPKVGERSEPSSIRALKNETGLTLVETMIALVILGGGLLALASAFAQGMILISTSHNQQIAKEKASEAIESVFTSRDTRIITWAQIRNIGMGGIFLDGPQPLRAPGRDGLVNTSDDGAVECETLPGPDNQLGTGDDIVITLSDFRREIEIRDIAPNLRQIRVIVNYRVGHLDLQYQMISYISSFA